MKVLGLVLVFALVTGLVAMGWQHARYLRARRSVCQDLQPVFHGGDVFHVLDFLEVRPGGDVLEEVRKLRDALETRDGVLVVYAGLAALTARSSSQIEGSDWDAVLLTQYRSRADFDAVADGPERRRALAAFERTYTHGFQRPPVLNLGIPAMLLGLHVVNTVSGNVPPPELTPEPAAAGNPDLQEMRRRFDAVREYGEDAVVIVNLMQRGTPEQQAADASYGRKMLGRMAARGHGPIHMGRPVTVEGDARFDQAVIVYYPGVDYMKSLFGSTFFQGIVGDKQLADTQAIPTVPILGSL